MKSTLQNLKFILIPFSLVVSAGFFTSCDDDEKPKTIPVVTTAAVTDVTTNSAIGGGEITDNGNVEITASGLLYSSITETPTVADSKTELTTATTGSFTSLMENLSSGTTYHVRAYATNSIGTGYGEVVDFATGNAAPVASNVSVTGAVEVNKVLTATYTYSDAENNAESGSTFKWYMANDGTGAGETAIDGATSLTYTIQDAAQGKYLRFGVTPKATTGNTTGIEVKSAFVGAVGEPTTVTFTYNGASVTYGILTSAATGRKWLDRNLGAPNTPTAHNNYQNYGDLFQWGRLADGHQLMLRNGPSDADMTPVKGTTSISPPFQTVSSDNPGHSLFIINGDIPNDWRSPQNNSLWQGVNGINNPCPSGWRMATATEWSNENLGTITEAYTKLKITYTSIRAVDSGLILQSATTARYWTSSVDATDPTRVTRVSINSTSTVQGAITRGNGYVCRCIKN